MRSWSFRSLIAAVLLLAASGAMAQTPPAVGGKSDLDRAKDEYSQGVINFNLGKWDEAYAHFEKAYSLSSKSALLFNLAEVNRKRFESTKNTAYLEECVRQLRTFVDVTDKPKDRERGLAELKSAQEALDREKAARAKGEEALAVGEEFLVNGRFDEAQKQLETYEHTPNNERAGVVRALLLRGGIAAAQDRRSDAVDAYASALELDRAIDDRTLVAPAAARQKATSALVLAREKVAGTPALLVTHAAPASHTPGKPLVLEFRGSPDPMGLVRGVWLHYRAGAGAFSSLPEPVPLGRVSLPGPFLATLLPGARVEYYASVVDKNGAVLQHFGTETVPFVVQVEKPQQNLAKKWWVWASVGGALAVIAGGTVLTYELVNPPPTSIPIPTGLTIR